MNRIIRLSDCDHIPVKCEPFAAENIILARIALKARNLRYDNKTGRIRDNTGELERFVNESEHIPHKTLEEVMEWEFSRYVRNGASRLERGYAV